MDYTIHSQTKNYSSLIFLKLQIADSDLRSLKIDCPLAQNQSEWKIQFSNKNVSSTP